MPKADGTFTSKRVSLNEYFQPSLFNPRGVVHVTLRIPNGKEGEYDDLLHHFLFILNDITPRPLIWVDSLTN